MEDKEAATEAESESRGRRVRTPLMIEVWVSRTLNERPHISRHAFRCGLAFAMGLVQGRIDTISSVPVTVAGQAEKDRLLSPLHALLLELNRAREACL